MKLTLPLPPSPNDVPSHPMELHKAKNRYRTSAWTAAIQQVRPHFPENLPKKVRVEATLFVYSLRDEDNGAYSASKWVLDTLKAKQRGKLAWKRGLFVNKGYLVDDDPKHCTVVPPVQVIDRANPRVEITITPLGD